MIELDRASEGRPASPDGRLFFRDPKGDFTL